MATFASSKRFSSCSVRTKARITRTPARVSRITWLMRSRRIWLVRNSGMARLMVSPMTMASAGSTTSSSPDSGTSWRSAMMIPPTTRIGAEMITVRAMNTTIWICWMSLVLRVISEAGPKWFISTWENVSTLVKMASRTSRPKPMAMRALR